ncbi:ANTAR domain-containing protein [Streptomyces sp. ODS28]|uniref:ANTAR domain-containing response regulator n=1 Tax=Streptomyces sp. ODS28 TaxID=3136688 RepID=UPI0031E744E3
MTPQRPIAGSPQPLAGERLIFEAEDRAGEAAPGRSLAGLAEQAARCTPGCCGAAATATDLAAGADEELALPDAPLAVTHPDLSGLIAVQWEAGEGPVLEALRTNTPLTVDDLLREERWPGFRAKALEAGLRSTATLPYRRQDLALTVTVCAFRPHRLAEAVCSNAALLGDLASTVMVRDRRYREALAEVDQLGCALRTRPVVDQACGIVMAVVGCSADEAFALLRRLSQRTNRKLHDLAEGVVHTRGRGAEEQLRRLSRTQ